jgi:hypothetical protein
MGNPFLFADRFSGAVVHLTTNNLQQGVGWAPRPSNNKTKLQIQKMPATAELTQAFPD